jgi:diguanylate cyclase (GGDEF)-like protein/PAS domain S-box-containing protein
MRFRNLSIRFNLALLTLSASVIAVLLASLGFAIYERQSYRASAVREVTALADTLGANTAASLAFNDERAAREMLSALSTEPNVLAAGLYDEHGHTFAEYDRAGSRSVPVFPAIRRDGAYFGSESLVLFRGVLLNGERTGSIVLVFDLRGFRSRLLEYAEIAIVVILISVIVTFLASIHLAASIADPLVQLAALAGRISTDKNYSVRAKIHAGGEAGLLVTAFNEMLSRIESREQALRDALKSLQESEERYALAARGANDGLWDWNLITNEIYFSPRWGHMLGYSEKETWSSPEDWFAHIHPGDRQRVRDEIAAHCAGKTPEFVSEYRMRHKSGGYIWTLSRGIAVRDSSGKALRMAGSQTDITEGKIADPLTHIPNRLYFIDRLESAIESAAQKDGTPFAVLFVDLDGFKLINDNLGHAAGDEMLIDVAGRLGASIRSNSRRSGVRQSAVARIGGDEFAVLLLNNQKESDASIVAARVLDRLSQPFYFEGHRMFVAASIGIALSSTGGTPEELLRNADTAMYQAKNNGKGGFAFFNEELRQQVDTRFDIETGLRKAIDEGQLVLHYQPIVSDNNGRICGFEALVRWNHPVRGLIPPGEFIPIAEESDLIVLLGRWVLREACLQAAEWGRKFAPDPPLTVSVNVSSRQLSNPHLVEDVEAALKLAQLSPHCLALEMTEGSIMRNAEQTLITFHHMKTLGVRLGIDDFGTGYSSLSYLQHLPFDVLKIDRSFVLELTAGKGSIDIVRAILALARSLKLDVIAEGVETEQQLFRLRKLGCTYFQGFLFSKPVDAATAEALYLRTRDSGFFPVASGAQPPADSKTSLLLT